MCHNFSHEKKRKKCHNFPNHKQRGKVWGRKSNFHVTVSWLFRTWLLFSTEMKLRVRSLLLDNRMILSWTIILLWFLSRICANRHFMKMFLCDVGLFMSTYVWYLHDAFLIILFLLLIRQQRNIWRREFRMSMGNWMIKWRCQNY